MSISFIGPLKKVPSHCLVELADQSQRSGFLNASLLTKQGLTKTEHAYKAPRRGCNVHTIKGKYFRSDKPEPARAKSPEKKASGWRSGANEPAVSGLTDAPEMKGKLLGDRYIKFLLTSRSGYNHRL